MIDGHETHTIPQMGRDKWWWEQYEQGYITRKQWLKSFLGNTLEEDNDQLVQLALSCGRLTPSEYLEYRKTGIVPSSLK